MSKAIVPLVIGIVLVAAATALTIWNERRSSGAADVRALVRTELADAEAEHVDQQLEGHIVRVVGMTTAEGEVSEPALGRTVPALRLDRIAETAQWEEKQIIAQGGRDLEYSLVWSPTRIDSTRFRDAGGAHPNPPLQLAPASLLAPSPNLGAWSADAELWHAIPATQALELPEQVAVDNVGTVRRFGEWWWSGDPSKPAPGDVRLRYLVVPHGKVTLVGRVESGRLVPVAGKAGEPLALGAVGDVPGELLVGDAGKAATIEAWKARALALAVFLLGSLIMASGLKRLTPELLGRFGGSVPSLGSILGLLLWLGISVTVWLLFRVR